MKAKENTNTFFKVGPKRLFLILSGFVVFLLLAIMFVIFYLTSSYFGLNLELNWLKSVLFGAVLIRKSIRDM